MAKRKEANRLVTDLFFDLAHRYLEGGVSIVLEAAFQHRIWESQMTRIEEMSSPSIVVCTVSAALAAERHLQRGLADPRREFFHSDARVAAFRETGTVLPPGDYQAPSFDVPTMRVSTEDGYNPGIDSIVDWIRVQLLHRRQSTTVHESSRSAHCRSSYANMALSSPDHHMLGRALNSDHWKTAISRLVWITESL